MRDQGRIYRGVLLHADEADRLNRDAEDERETCCPHLDVFHNRGQREDGSHWKACQFFGCQCPGEDHGSSPGQRCRDCNIQYSLESMQCSVCERMRYRTETPLGDIGAWLWGEPCVCDPRPPTVYEAKARPA